MIRPDGTHKRTLARPGKTTSLGGASWSPADGPIAYFKTRVQCGLDGCRRDKLMLIDQSGENPRTLVRRHGFESYDWSPDGTKIIFACRCGRDQDELFVVDVASRVVTRITRTAGSENAPKWSPDGDRIITIKWSADASGRARLVTLAPDGSSPEIVVTRLRGYPSPSWSPDGDRVVFLRGERSEIFVIDEDGTNERQVTTDRKDQVDPTWQSR